MNTGVDQMKLTNPKQLLLMGINLLNKFQIKRVIKRFLRSGQEINNVTYEGIFKDFSQVFSTYKKNVGYVTEEYLISEKDKVAGILAKPSEQYKGNDRDHYLLLLLSSIPKDIIKILDVGSGFGLTFHFLNDKLEKKLEYTGVDLPEISEIAFQKFGHHYNYNFSNLFDIQDQEFDVVYFGSSLQYFQDYKKTLTQVLANSPQMVCIADTPVGEIETFVTCQVNMKNRKIPRWVFSLSEINEIFNGAKYELINTTKVDWHNDIHNFSNFPEEYHHISHMNLVYRRLESA